MTVTARDRSGTVTAPPIVLDVSEGPDPGFVRTARGAPRYFAFDDGRPYVAVGENLCWSSGPRPLADYTAWLRGLGQAGGNWARLWLSFGEKGQEWMSAPTPKPGRGSYLGLGRYALDNAWRLDQIVRLARGNGVCLMFCLGTYGEFTDGGYFNEGSWISNPYNARNGGPCAGPAEFWTHPRARQLYQRRLRYLVARWGHAVNLFAWEFWNEVPPSREQVTWIAEMARYLKRTDPYHHLVSTTYGDTDTWALPEIDFTMIHMYGQAGNTADFTERIRRDVQDLLVHRKPCLLAEFGIDWQTEDGKWDRMASGLNMHNGAWAALFSGAAGTAMLWYWDGYVHPHGLYRVLTPVRRFADTIDWTREPFVPLRDLHAEFVGPAPETFTDLTIAADVEWGRTPKSEYTVRRDGTVEGRPVAATLGSPARGRPGELHGAVTWHVDLPAEGRMILHLGDVSTRAVLQVCVDGQERLRRELLAGEEGKGPWKRSRYLEQYKVWVSTYDEAVPVAVAAGRHAVTVANLDGDWLQISRVALPGYRSDRYPDVDLVGIASDRLALLWLHHRQSIWRIDFDGGTPRTLADLEVTVPGLADGHWRAQWWDTFVGEPLQTETVAAAGGRLRLKPPPLARDLALRAERRE